MKNTFLLVIILLQIFKLDGQETKYLFVRNDSIFSCSLPNEEISLIFGLNKNHETNFSRNSFYQNMDTLIFSTYTGNQKMSDFPERYKYHISLKTMELSVKKETSAGRMYQPFYDKKEKNIDTMVLIDFFDGNNNLWQARHKSNYSREIGNKQIITRNGNIYLKSGESIRLLLEHYAQNQTFNSKFNVGYLFPELSQNGKNCICLDTYYNGVGRRKVRRYYLDSYIIKINLKTLKSEPVFKVPKSRISNIRYSPNDRYIYFYSESKDIDYYGNFVYDTKESKLVRVKRFIMWLK